MNITIIGSGSFGCSIAYSLSKNKNNNIKIWSYKKEECDLINNEHRCMYIDNLLLDSSIKCTLDYEEAIENSNIVILVTPSSVFKKTCIDIKEYITNQEIVILTKGICEGKLLSDIVENTLNKKPTVISGPSHAEQIAKNIPTFFSISGNKELIKVFETDCFKLEYNDDIIGIQVGAALKNIISIAIGICEGLGYESNTISYIITKGLDEIKNIAVTLGGKESTIYDLSGLGDLLTTSLSMDSRNKRAGILIAKGKTLDEVKEEIGMTIEGIDALQSAKNIIDKYNLDCKIIGNMYNIIYNNSNIESIL